MSKLNKDFKNEFDDEFRSTKYATRRVTLLVVLWIGLLTLVGGTGTLLYTRTFGVAQRNAEREVFKQSNTYNEAAANFLAKEYSEYSKATTDTEKRTICQYVILRYPNLDTSKIDNLVLRAFYDKCLTN